MSEAGGREFVKLATTTTDGFAIFHHKPGSTILIPTGYVIITCGNFKDESLETGGSCGLRWGVLDSNLTNLEATLEATTSMLVAYPQLKDGDYKTWQELLKTSLIPQSSPTP